MVEKGNTEKERVPQIRRRVVTVPQIDPSKAWNVFSARQQRIRRERAKPPMYTTIVRRAHAQIGVPASGERMAPLRRLPPMPDRSGRRAARRSFWWRLLSFFGLGVTFLLAATFAFTSNAFRIEQVNVTGTHNTILINAIQRMGMQGQNIFLLDVAGLTDRIEAWPLVASASLSKQWPNALTVQVVERKPALLWQTAQGTYSVDSQGMVIALASETSGTDHLHSVMDTSSQQYVNAQYSLRPGTHLNPGDIAFALEVFTRLPQIIGTSSFQLRFDGTIYTGSLLNSDTQMSRGSFTVASSSGWIAYLGGADDTNPLENRLIELQHILAVAQQQQLSLATVDLRYGLRPVYTLQQQETSKT
jgi:cell division septal protein FtsQ